VNGASADQFEPHVTVVIPTYNYAGVLAYALDSVLHQTFQDFEVLVVGDGCTDDSERVVTAAGDPRAQSVNLSVHIGHQSGPNNEGLRRARGTIVAYLGHDDLWLPHHLEVLMEALIPGVPASHSSVLRAAPGVPCYTTPAPGWSYTRGAWIPPTSLAIRRSHAVEVGGWQDPTQTGYLDPEADLLARVFDIAGPPRWVPRVTCVKLAAAERRDVYRTRPTHEQAYWLAQIRTEDPERTISAHIGRNYDRAGDPVGVPIGLPRRAWRSARYRLRKGLGLSTTGDASARHRRNQRFKGVD